MQKWIIITVTVAGILLSSCSDEQVAEKPVRPVRTATVQIQDIGETVIQTGEVQPRFTTEMSFRIGGQLIKRVDNGTIVKAGDVVARIDPVPAENNLQSARAELATAKAELELASLNAERARTLFEKNVTSRAQMQQAEATLATAKARQDSAETAVATASDNLSYTELKAVRDGIVSAVSANEGQNINTGQAVLTLISETERDAVFDVPERLIDPTLVGTTIDVALISAPEVTAKGIEREATPSADPATRTYRVKVTLDDDGRKMPFGAAVSGSIALAPKRLVALPASSLTENTGQSAVFVVDRQTGRIGYRNVKVERYTGTQILIADGLHEGEVVATSGVAKLRDGETVKVEKNL